MICNILFLGILSCNSRRVHLTIKPICHQREDLSFYLEIVKWTLGNVYKVQISNETQKDTQTLSYCRLRSLFLWITVQRVTWIWCFPFLLNFIIYRIILDNVGGRLDIVPSAVLVIPSVNSNDGRGLYLEVVKEVSLEWMCVDKSTGAKFIVPAQWNGNSAEIWRLYGEKDEEEKFRLGFLDKGRSTRGICIRVNSFIKFVRGWLLWSHKAQFHSGHCMETAFGQSAVERSNHQDLSEAKQ